jgi:hypothetical protein
MTGDSPCTSPVNGTRLAGREQVREILEGNLAPHVDKSCAMNNIHWEQW